MIWLTLILIAGLWITNKNIKRTEKNMVTSIQDYKNQADSINNGWTQRMNSINSKINELKNLIVAGGTVPPDQLQLLDDVLTQSNANLEQTVLTDNNANPPTP